MVVLVIAEELENQTITSILIRNNITRTSTTSKETIRYFPLKKSPIKREKRKQEFSDLCSTPLSTTPTLLHIRKRNDVEIESFAVKKEFFFKPVHLLKSVSIFPRKQK
jgi:hypothetical protein